MILRYTVHLSWKRLPVSVTENERAYTADTRWQALDRDYDEGVSVGSGATPVAAVDDLMWHLGIEDYEIELETPE